MDSICKKSPASNIGALIIRTGFLLKGSFNGFYKGFIIGFIIWGP